MKKCKICGAIFEYHITNSHLETHGITRKEYNQLEGKDDIFYMVGAPYNKTEEEATNHAINAINRNRKRKNRYDYY
ncbi:hypothetical protein [Romboutsia timonensis]|uniref:hypothetical protein n=1 Tax=Romboutsia timonensis TaxID=1776391 RepID=UPI0023F86868|nr:hypothetical protein [Romboutsia timonensis]